MSNYTKSTNFATKDNLTPGDPLKVVRGTEIDTEYNNIATAVATKTDNASAAITGGTITGITDLAVADGGTGASTAATALNNLLPSQTSNANKYLQTDGTNATWDAVSLSTADITGTLGVANGGTGVTTSTGTTNVVLSNSPTLVTPALGTPSSAVLTNATGLPISTGVSGLGTGVATFLGTPSSANLASAITDETGSGSLVFATSPTLVTPILGTPTSGTLTNATGLPISTGVSGLGTGVATFLATPSSANLISAVTDETGTGSLVFATSPTLVTPALGTPSALVGTNITGTASGLTAGNVTTNANLTGAVTSVGNATSLGSFTSAQLASALTDETGSGANVFATSPTLVTPTLGVATATSLQGIIGNVTPAAGNFTTLGATGVATFSAGTAALPALTTTGDTNTGIFFPAADTIAASTSGTERLRLTSTGQLLLGTVTPDSGLSVDIQNVSATSNNVVVQIKNTIPSEDAGLFISGFSTSQVEYRIGINTITGTPDLTFSGPTGFQWWVNNSQQAKIPLTGGFQSVNSISVGNATPTTSGAGITFPATQSASSDANTLDDYEEGAWTPSIGGTATYTLQQGVYTKIGRIVILAGVLQVNSLGTGSVNTISGLPFAAANNTAQAPGSMTFISALASSVVSINPRIAIGTSSIAFNSLGAAGNVQNDTTSVFQNGARVDFQITYAVTV